MTTSLLSHRPFFQLAVFFAAALLLAPLGYSVIAQTQPPLERAIPASRPPTPRTAGFKTAVVTDKPRAGYTEEAKYNGVEGSVRLRVELLGTGQVGEVVPLSYLPWGLTEQAIRAARLIRFQPRTYQGKPVDTTIEVEYTFSLYYEDTDAEITSKVEIQRMPKPEIAAAELPPAANGKIELKVFFSASGRASILNTLSAVPVELQPRLREAVDKIRFRPAMHRSGKRSGVTKTIVYEL